MSNDSKPIIDNSPTDPAPPAEDSERELLNHIAYSAVHEPGTFCADAIVEAFEAFGFDNIVTAVSEHPEEFEDDDYIDGVDPDSINVPVVPVVKG